VKEKIRYMMRKMSTKERIHTILLLNNSSTILSHDSTPRHSPGWSEHSSAKEWAIS
jgi:hypothetical protein